MVSLLQPLSSWERDKLTHRVVKKIERELGWVEATSHTPTFVRHFSYTHHNLELLRV